VTSLGFSMYEDLPDGACFSRTMGRTQQSEVRPQSANNRSLESIDEDSAAAKRRASAQAHAANVALSNATLRMNVTRHAQVGTQWNLL
jgi:hypothetical protein